MPAESSMHGAWGVAFSLLLLAGCITDVRTRRIPNLLVLVLLLAGFAYSASVFSWPDGLWRSGAGVGVGFAIWIGFHLAGVIGAGDVKFFSAAGAWLGAGATWRAAVIAALAGGVLAAVFLLRQRRLTPAARGLWLAATTGSLSLVRPQESGTAGNARSLPYGVALAVGALAVAWLPGLLA